AAPADEGDNLDLDNMGDFGLPDEAAPADEGDNLDLDNMGDFGLPDEAAPADEGENLDLDNMGDFGLPDEAAPADEGDNLDLDNMGDFGLPDEAAPADEGEDLDLDSLAEMGLADEPAPADSKDDSAGIDDFDFPELDNVLKKSGQKTTDTSQKAAKKGKSRGKAKRVKTEVSPDDVEEIQLSDDEFEGLQETLSRYPLNLRIACEEIIVEQAVNPKQLSELIEHLVWGATAKETAVLAGHILGKTITVPKGFEKSSGAALEAEQASFAYIFVHNFLPVLRVFMFIAVVVASLFYLVYNFIYIPLKAEEIYKIGYERISAGEYQRANQRFSEAFGIHRKKVWFYKYAEAFRDERQYIYAEQKYEELLRYYLRDKKGILDYANLETYYLRNYAKADSLLRNQLLDYAPNDPDGLLAAGDNCLMWGEVDPSKYEDARYYYARLLEKYGWKAPVVERMMKYFIRTDNLKETLILKNWFDNNPKWELSAESMGELGGYLLDKQLEEARGVPNEYIEYIDGVRDLLLKAVYADPSLPEPHYHLARYYRNLGNTHEERVTLRIAVRTFDEAHEVSVRRLNYHIDAIQRYADVLINDREFIPAEEQLIKGINLYEDAVERRLISRSSQYGKLYAGLGDLEYFTKTGDMEAALRYYHRSEQNGWSPPEMKYRMGSAYYQLEDWRNALEYLFASSSSLPLNRRILFALGNTALKRGNYFAAQGYYDRLLDILESQRVRLPVLLPNDRPEYLELAERLMMARNNAGVACEMLASQTGNRSYLTRAISFYAEAERAWDARTRDPRTMIRSGSTPLPYLNTRNALHPQTGYEPQIFIRIDREALENSPWEELSPLLRLEHGKSN
ncbi:MAG: tetratricopeptide repeat protein, partial [Treponema sp.]|nr:tetratricopeptide repeat protein [Treponema sp.]